MKKVYFVAIFTLLFVSVVPLFTACTENELLDGGEGDLVNDSITKEVVITLDSTQVTVGAEEAEYEIFYTLENAGEDFKIVASTESDWITFLNTQTSGVVKFIVSENTTTETREASVYLLYTCEKDSVQTSFDVKQEASENEIINSPLKLTVPETGSTWATITIDAEDDNMRYMISRVEADVMEAYLSDEAFIEDEIRAYQEMADYYGLPLEQVLDFYTLKGDKPTADEGDIAFTVLEANTDYYAYCYGFDSNWNVATPVIKVKFTTKSIGSENLTSIEFQNVVYDARQVSFDVVPSSFDSYTCMLYSRSEYDEATKNMEAFKTELATSGYSLFGGPLRSNSITGLTPSTDYVLVAMGIAANTPTSDIFTYNFRTNDAVESAATFNFECKYCDGVEFEKVFQLFGQDMIGYCVLYPKCSVTDGVDYRYAFLDSSETPSDDEILSYLSVNGFGKEYEGYVFTLPYDQDVIVYGVGIDADGNFGKLVKNSMTINKDDCITVDEMIEYIGLSRSGSVAPWLKLAPEFKAVKPAVKVLQPKSGLSNHIKFSMLK